MPFALNNNPELSEVADAINYLLGNFGANIAADPVSGEITGPTGIVIAYLYKYLAVKYADSADGSVNFSDSPTNRGYYGLRNTNDSAESANPADYIWNKVAGGFSTTKFLFYQTNGGRQVEFFVGTTAPNSYFIAVPSTAIDLDVVTGSSGQQFALPTIYQWTSSSTPPTRPSTTSTYTWATATFTAPSGWSTSIPSAPGSGYYLWSISVPLVVSINVTTSVINWTNTSYPITAIGITGTSGTTGPRTSTGYVYYQLSSSSAPSAPTLAGFNFVTGQFSTISANWSTNFNAPAATDTTKFWAVYYSVSESTFGGTQTVTVSTVFNWTNFNGLVTFTNLATNTGTTFIDGGNIITNTLTVDKVTSGQTSVLNGGTFSLGASGTVLNGFSGVGAFESNTNGKWGLMAFLENASATQGAGLGACVFGNGAPALGAFSSTSISYNSFYTAFASATNFVAGNGRYNRSIGTPNNMDLIPFNSSVLNNNDNAGYFAHFGSSASSRVTEAFIANTTTLSAGVFRRYNTSGTTLLNETYLNNANYSVESTLGAIYSAGGYLPFTGVHDGLIEESENLAVGDIVVDYQVEAVLNPSNVVMLYKKSSTKNQKGVIGVCIEIFDVPPTDWNEYEQTGEVDPITGKPVPDPTPIPNPMYYPIPAGQKVIHVNALGEGTINVCGEGGDIEIGDLIVTSSIPGKGMKQSDDFVRSVTVAKSRQVVTFSSSTEVKQVACIYLGG
jgi:hypothetical protein